MDPTKDVAMRFSIPQNADFNLQNSGTWQTLQDGSKLWRLKNCIKRCIFNTTYL